MAEIIKETSTLNVTLIDTEAGETVFKINDPKTELTLAEVRNAYKDILGQEDVNVQSTAEKTMLYNADDKPLIFVAKATRVVVTTETTEIE